MANPLGWVEKQLRVAFYKHGKLCAAHPLPYLLIPILLTLAASGGLFLFHEEHRVWYLFSPSQAKSHREHQIMEEFFENEGGKFKAELAIMAVDSGSLLRPGYLEASIDLYDYVRFNLTITSSSELDKRVFADLCGLHCNDNDVIDVFTKIFRDPKMRNHPNFRLTYPIMRLYDKTYFIGNNLAGVDVDAYSKQITSVKVVLFIMRASRKNAKIEKIFHSWEKRLLKLVATFQHPLINFTASSDGITGMEVRRNGIHSIPFFAGSVLLIFSFVIFCGLNLEPAKSKPWESLLGATGPILSIIATFGLLFALGQKFVAIQLVMPFLVLAIGVDDCFILLHAWHQTDTKLSVQDRMAHTFAEAGPSITITSLTNAMSFGIGAFSSTPAIQSFCLFTATGIAIDFLFQITLFGAVLAFGGQREAAGKGPCFLCTRSENPIKTEIKKKKSVFLTALLRFRLSKEKYAFLTLMYSKLATSEYAKFFTSLLLVVYWITAGYGCSQLKVTMDVSKTVLSDSPLLTHIYVHSQIVWKEANPVTIFVNMPPNFKDSFNLKTFLDMTSEFEHLPRCIGKESTNLWLRPYLNYLQMYVPETNIKSSFYHYLTHWLDMDGVRWKTYLRLREVLNSNETKIDKFFFTITFHNFSVWSNRAESITAWRAVAAKYSQFNVSAFSEQTYMVDTQMYIGHATWITVLIALCAMFVICVLFIPNVVSVICATAALLSINIGVFGFLSLWSVDIDTISMSTILMSIGFSVDFTCHISYHYYKSTESEPQKRLMEALMNIGWPMLQAGVSTLLGVSVLLLVDSYMVQVFFKTVFLVVTLGLVHGLVILPVVLTALPRCASCRKPSSSFSDGAVELRNVEITDGPAWSSLKCKNCTVAPTPSIFCTETPIFTVASKDKI